jgi:hypothetical protein
MVHTRSKSRRVGERSRNRNLEVEKGKVRWWVRVGRWVSQEGEEGRDVGRYM